MLAAALRRWHHQMDMAFSFIGLWVRLASRLHASERLNAPFVEQK